MRHSIVCFAPLSVSGVQSNAVRMTTTIAKNVLKRAENVLKSAEK